MKGGFVTILVVIAVFAASLFFAAEYGLIAGLGGESKHATKALKKDVEALKGNKIEDKLVSYLGDYIEKDAFSSQEDKKVFNDALAEAAASNDIKLNFESIEELEVSDKAAIKIANPVISAFDTATGDGVKVSVSNIEILRDVKNPNHYFYKESGDIQVFAGSGSSEEKVLGINYQTDGTEIRVSDEGEVEYTKSSAKNIEFVEGRGETVLVKVREASSEQINKRSNGKVSQSMKAEYNGIEPGDMLKMMVGNIDPISVKMHFNYNGDDMQKGYSNYIKQAESNLDNIQDALAGKKIEDGVEKAKLKNFEGDLNLNNFSILMGDSGFKANGDLTFAGNVVPMPKGSLEVVFANYQKLTDFLMKFFPMPPSESEKAINFLKEIGETRGNDIVFNFGFDGTENVRIDGKTLEEIQAIHKKYDEMPVEGVNAETTPIETAPMESQTQE